MNELDAKLGQAALTLVDRWMGDVHDIISSFLTLII